MPGCSQRGPTPRYSHTRYSHNRGSDRITLIGKHAQQVLKAGSGHVIALFNHSFYLSTAEQRLCCVGTSELVGGPINIRTSQRQLPPIALNARWHCEGQCLYVGSNIALDYSDGLIFQPPQRLNTETIALPDVSTLTLLKVSPAAKIGNLESKVEQRLQAGAEAIEQWLPSPSQPLPDAVVQLLGCGEGLTPSGDDILVGVMAALYQLNYDQKLSLLARCIHTYAHTHTNQISQAHLLASCEGMAVEPLQQFITAIFSGDIASVETATESLHHYGHRSGRDAMRGVMAVVNSLIVPRQTTTSAERIQER